MSDRTRQALAFVIAIGMVIAVASAPTVAQVADPSAEQVFELTAVNADTVDNRHAVPYTTKKGKRAGKLVATNANGFLPSNILKPQWRVIQNKPEAFADDDIVSWAEVKFKPPGFKDGVDNIGTPTTLKLRHFGVQKDVKPGNADTLTASCPAGSLAVGGGYRTFGNGYLQVTDSWTQLSSRNAWVVVARNVGTTTYPVHAYVVCLSTSPEWALSKKK